jgi:nicotinamidase/pyrazinamidase
MRALLIVDVQKDFCPGGALAASEGDAVVPVINSLLDHFDLVIASKDWHPADTEHFLKWPKHCVQETPGADFHPGLRAEKIGQVFLKGTSHKDDGYSFFEATNLDPEKYLHDQHVDELYICGLATDYCVKASALDALAKGFHVSIIEDAVRGVEAHPGDVSKAVVAMKEKGARFVRAADLLN